MKETIKAERMIRVFVLGFIACAIIGNIINGPIPHYSDKGFYAFFYVKIPNLLATVIGFPIVSTGGRIFTLVASLFFVIIALKLYCVDVGCDFKDMGAGAENGLRRTFQFLGSFFYLNMVCVSMLHIKWAREYLEHKFWSFFPLLFFVIYIFAWPSIGSDGKKEMTKAVCRFCSAISITLGIAGISAIFLTYQLADEMVLPAKITYKMWLLSEEVGGTVAGIVIILLLLALFSAFAAAGIVLLERTCDDVFVTVPLSGGFIYFLFMMKFRWNGIVTGHDIKYWLLLICMVIVWSVITGRRGTWYRVSTFLGGMLVFIFTLSCISSANVVYGAIVNCMRRFFSPEQRMSVIIAEDMEKIGSVFSKGIAWEIGILIVISAAFIVWITALAYRRLDKDFGSSDDSIMGNVRIPLICSAAFLVGMIMWNIDASESQKLNKINDFVGYAGTVFPIVITTFAIVTCAMKQNSKGVRRHILGIGITIIMTPVVILFAEPFYVVLICILGIICFVAVMSLMFGSLRYALELPKAEVLMVKGSSFEFLKVNKSGDKYYDPDDNEWHDIKDIK